MATIKAWAAKGPKEKLVPFEYEAGPLGPEEVDIEVEYCGLCHSDLSMLNNDWGITSYPFVPGHEAIGRVVALGQIAAEKGLTIGQRVGVGWNSYSCLHCDYCLAGEHQLCEHLGATIVGRYGAFGERVRSHWVWAVPIPDGVDASSAGPLLCGGITVFDPILHREVLPTQRVGVFGIGGLGHMAIKFLAAWGCDVTAFTSNERKYDEVRSFGAATIASSTDPAQLKAFIKRFDFLLITANVALEWDLIISLLRPGGKLHLVGVVPKPISAQVMPLLMGQKQISGSPTGSRSHADEMLRFAARHGVAPKVEHYPMSKVNEALDHLKAGKANYRIVLDM